MYLLIYFVSIGNILAQNAGYSNGYIYKGNNFSIYGKCDFNYSLTSEGDYTTICNYEVINKTNKYMVVSFRLVMPCGGGTQTVTKRISAYDSAFDYFHSGNMSCKGDPDYIGVDNIEVKLYDK